MERKRRALVLGDESARHPFLRSLPPHVRKVAPEPRWRWGLRDVRQFLTAYCACFMAVTVFIA